MHIGIVFLIFRNGKIVSETYGSAKLASFLTSSFFFLPSCFLVPAFCPLLFAYCLLPIAYGLLVLVFWFLPIAYCPLPIATCLLFFGSCYLFPYLIKRNVPDLFSMMAPAARANLTWYTNPPVFCGMPLYFPSQPFSTSRV